MLVSLRSRKQPCTAHKRSVPLIYKNRAGECMVLQRVLIKFVCDTGQRRSLLCPRREQGLSSRRRLPSVQAFFSSLSLFSTIPTIFGYWAWTFATSILHCKVWRLLPTKRPDETFFFTISTILAIRIATSWPILIAALKFITEFTTSTMNKRDTQWRSPYSSRHSDLALLFQK